MRTRSDICPTGKPSWSNAAITRRSTSTRSSLLSFLQTFQNSLSFIPTSRFNLPILYPPPSHIAICEVKCRHCAHARKFPELSIANGRNQTGEVVYYAPFKRTKVRYKLIGKPPALKTGVPPESQLAKLEMMNQSSSTSFKSSKWFLRTEMTPSLHSLPISAESALRSTQRKSASACLSKGISNFSELLRIDWP